MKSLYIIRHAKSSWGDFTQPDFERPLNERGKKDAPVMAGRLLDAGIKIDRFISSPAKRAHKTCKLFVEAYKREEDDIKLVAELYHASSPIFYEVVSSIPDKYNSAAIFSHNPGITDFVNSFDLNVNIDNMPTCSIFGLRILVESWREFADAKKEYLFFQYPKQL